MAYLSIPIAGDADLNIASARTLRAIFQRPDAYPIALACASGNRAGALLALEKFWLERLPAEDALRLGQSAGLTRLEPTVRFLLGLPAGASGHSRRRSERISPLRTRRRSARRLTKPPSSAAFEPPGRLASLS